jgi:hypothetical protein
VAIVIGMPICINTRHNRRYNVGVFGGCNRPKEYVSAVAGREEHVIFSLEAEIEEMALTELKDCGVLRPNGLCNWDSGVKPWDEEFQNSPQ